MFNWKYLVVKPTDFFAYSMNNKATIFDIQRSSFYDGPGIRTTVFFKGCPLSCLWCHNPESQSKAPELFFYYDKCILCGNCRDNCPNNGHQLEKNTHKINYTLCQRCNKCIEQCNESALKMMGTEMSVDQIMEVVAADIDFYKRSNGGVTLSGGEPLMQFSFAMKLLKSCKDSGINTCIETSAFVASEKFRKILPFIDVLLFDYKITGAEEHKKYTGVSNELILANLDIAYHSGTPIILRCPVIPGINDTTKHFEAISKLDKKYPDFKGIELMPYHDTGNNKRTSIGKETTLSNLKTTPPDLVSTWLEQLKRLKCNKAIIGWG